MPAVRDDDREPAHRCAVAHDHARPGRRGHLGGEPVASDGDVISRIEPDRAAERRVERARVRLRAPNEVERHDARPRQRQPAPGTVNGPPPGPGAAGPSGAWWTARTVPSPTNPIGSAPARVAMGVGVDGSPSAVGATSRPAWITAPVRRPRAGARRTGRAVARRGERRRGCGRSTSHATESAPAGSAGAALRSTGRWTASRGSPSVATVPRRRTSDSCEVPTGDETGPPAGHGATMKPTTGPVRATPRPSASGTARAWSAVSPAGSTTRLVARTGRDPEEARAPERRDDRRLLARKLVAVAKQEWRVTGADGQRRHDRRSEGLAGPAMHPRPGRVA